MQLSSGTLLAHEPDPRDHDSDRGQDAWEQEIARLEIGRPFGQQDERDPRTRSEERAEELQRFSPRLQLLDRAETARPALCKQLDRPRDVI